MPDPTVEEPFAISLDQPARKVPKRPLMAAGVILALLALTGCGILSSPSRESRPFVRVTTERRDRPPADVGDDWSMQVLLPEVLDDEGWAAWGPAGDPGPTPVIPEGMQALIVWDSTPSSSVSFRIDGYDITDDGLVILATSTAAKGGCYGFDVMSGTTTVLAAEDPELVPGIRIAPPEITEVTTGCG